MSDKSWLVRAVSRIAISSCLLATACGRIGFDSLTEEEPAECNLTTVLAVDIRAAGNSTCALLSDESLWCWGANDSGQLGDGTRESRTTPARVGTLGAVARLAMGSRHICALDSTDQLFCWGRNHRGQLGTGNLSHALEPALVPGNPPLFRELAAGSKQSLGISVSGDLYSWGMPNGLDGSWETSPVEIPFDAAAVSIAGSSAPRASTGGHSCVALADGSLHCWGANADGQLGDGTTTSRNPPAVVNALAETVEVALGDAHTCALTAGSEVYCWGQGRSIGLGSTEDQSLPSRVPIEGVAQLVAGGDGTCARRTDGTVWCWGDTLLTNGESELSPTQVPGLENISRVTRGDDHACALRSDGAVLCWGADRFGQEGRVDLPWSLSETEVVGLPGPVDSLISTLGDFSCALIASELWCWGDNSFGQLGADGGGSPRLTMSDVKSAVGGRDHLCAVTGAGTVRCQGSNSTAQLGDLDTNERGPVEVQGPTNVLALALGGNHSCALDTSNEVWCWGSNSEGRTLQSGSMPTVAGLAMVSGTGISAGSSHTCVLLADDTAVCFGRGNEDQIGNASLMGDAYEATPVDDIGNIEELAAGLAHSCARRADGSVWCWGYNDEGQLGRGIDTERSDSAQPVTELSEAVELVCGYNHCCARHSDNRVSCWGSGANGQLGDGATGSQSSPVTARALDGVEELSAGRSHTCGRRADGSVICVGSRTFSQLGGTDALVDRSPSISQISCE